MGQCTRERRGKRWPLRFSSRVNRACCKRLFKTCARCKKKARLLLKGRRSPAYPFPYRVFLSFEEALPASPRGEVSPPHLFLFLLLLFHPSPTWISLVFKVPSFSPPHFLLPSSSVALLLLVPSLHSLRLRQEERKRVERERETSRE